MLSMSTTVILASSWDSQVWMYGCRGWTASERHQRLAYKEALLNRAQPYRWLEIRGVV